MSISFNRSRTQVAFEGMIGVTSTEELATKKEEFRIYQLSDNDVRVLKISIKEDAVDYLYNGIISFVEGIDSIYSGRFSWATVKLYYSIFYLLRASMASKDIGILRNKNMYRLRIRKGESPFSTNNQKYNTTHQGTINHYKDLFLGSDKLLTNKIEDKDVYEWMQDVREIINYREISFQEPGYLNIWEKFAQAVNDSSIGSLLFKLQEDTDYKYCFQEEYAVVGIPIKRMVQTIYDFQVAGLLNHISRERLEYSKEVLCYDDRQLQILTQVFN